MSIETEAQQLDDKGKLGPIQDICVVAAQRAYLKRRNQDTNPQIVQMVLCGEVIPHWYYRSDEWIDQPYFIPQNFVQPYRGPVVSAYPWLYGEKTYVVDNELIRLTDEGLYDSEIM